MVHQSFLTLYEFGSGIVISYLNGYSSALYSLSMYLVPSSVVPFFKAESSLFNQYYIVVGAIINIKGAIEVTHDTQCHQGSAFNRKQTFKFRCIRFYLQRSFFL